MSIGRYDSEATARVNETENNEPGDRYAPAREIVKDEMSAAQLAALSPEERAMHMADVRAINPIRTAIGDVVTNVGVVPFAKNVYEGLKYGDLGKPLPPEAPRAPVRDIQPGEFTLSPTEQARVNEAENNEPGDRYAPVSSAGITSVAPVAPALAPVAAPVGITSIPSQFPMSPSLPTVPTVPTVTSETALPKDEQEAINTSLFQAMVDAMKNPSEIGPVVPQNVTASLPGPVTDSPTVDTAPPAPPAPVAAPVAPAPVQMVNVTETYQGDDPNPPGGWTRVSLPGKDNFKHVRTVSVPASSVSGGGGGGGQGSQRGGESVGGYSGVDASRANSGQFGMDPSNRGGGRDGGEGGGGGFGRGYGSQGQHAAHGGLSTPYGFQHMARGGITSLPNPYNLGSYSDGGRLLKGPGDGVSDSIPATIGKGQPARLADGEFVIPARIVSEIGNGSTDAGARKLYAMMDRIQKGRRKTVGRGKVAVNSRADRYLPA